MTEKIKVLIIFGTRPEAVKMAPIVYEAKKQTCMETTVCVTAQHRQMLDQVLQAFNIAPDIDLNLMRSNQTLAQSTADILSHLDPVFTQVKPDWILVQGDTTTVMAASILGYYHQVRVGHVEAGLRTHDKWQPFPEEVNRRIAGVVSDLHFCPTEGNRQNLLREGVPDDAIRITGNPAIDALKHITRQPAPPQVTDLLDELDISSGKKRLVLITAHRRENFGQPILDICQALRLLADRYRDTVSFLYAVHLNPNIQNPVYTALAGIPNLKLCPPLDYLPMAHMMQRATLLLTDSGGLQEEAPALGVPTLVLRQTTERPEGVTAGTLKLVGSDTQTIFDESCRLLDDPLAHQQMAKATNPFGDGHAAERIMQAIVDWEVQHGKN